MGAQYQLVHSGQLYGCMKMTRKFVQATQFSNVAYLQTAIFIKMALLKINFYFEVFKQLKNHVLNYLTGATQHKDTGIY